MCGLPFLEQESLGTEDSEVLEIEVKAHKRRIHRKRYKPSCQCPLPKIITAPGPAKLIPKGRYGVSVWVQILLDKYCFLRPTHRLLEDLRTYGLDLSLGTVTGGLKKLAPPALRPAGNASQTGTEGREPKTGSTNTYSPASVSHTIHGCMKYPKLPWIWTRAVCSFFARSSPVTRPQDRWEHPRSSCQPPRHPKCQLSKTRDRTALGQPGGCRGRR